jgi:hypothetical protein
MQKQNKKPDHRLWQGLLSHDKVKQIVDTHHVYQIQITPLDPPPYDCEARLIGEGEKAGVVFKHQTDCTWEQA